MNKRILGKTGLQVSEIAFGGVEIGMPYGIGVLTEADMLSEKEAIQLIHAAVDTGINFFDTARMYGNSESIMGKAFKGRRSDVIISTKCRHFRNEDGNIPSPIELRKLIYGSLEESLNALQTSYVDVYMLHQCDLEILTNPEIISVFTDLKQKGLVRSIGASTYSTEETNLALISGDWEVVQIPFNLMDQSHAALFGSAEKAGVGITVRSVLMKGLLGNSSPDLHPELYNVQQHIKKYNTLLDDSIPDLPGLALKFALSYKEVSSVLIGMDKLEYLHKSLEAADGHYFGQKKMNQLKELAYPEPGFLNLHHWQKSGWLK